MNNVERAPDQYPVGEHNDMAAKMLTNAPVISWKHDFASALEKATHEKRFVLADFSKEP